jgi:hypothetical protein
MSFYYYHRPVHRRRVIAIQTRLWILRYVNRYPNEQWTPVERCTLELAGDRWKTVSPTGCRRTARGRHIFVVQNRAILVTRARWLIWSANPIGHIDLARGEAIEFGGEIFFGSSYSGRGVLRKWNDRTGYYFDPSRPMNPRIVPLLPLPLFERDHMEV